MEQALVLVEKFLSNPILWGIATLVAIALALSGRFSVTAATWFMWAAWAMAVFGSYRLAVYFHVDILLRLLVVASLAFAFSVGVVLVNRWLNSGNPSTAVSGSSSGSAETPSNPNGGAIK